MLACEDMLPQHILHATRATSVIRCNMREAPCVARAAGKHERESLCGATQRLAQDADAKEAPIAHELREDVAGHDVEEQQPSPRAPAVH